MNSATDIEDDIAVAMGWQRYTAIITSAILALLIAATFRTLLNTELLGSWLTSILVVYCLRLFVIRYGSRLQHRSRLQLLLTMLSGLIWGLSAPLFLPYLDTAYQSILILTLIGLVAGCSSAYAGDMRLFYAFTLPDLIPLTLWLFMQQTGVYTTLGIAVLLYAVGLSIIARRNTLLLHATAEQNAQLTAEVALRQTHEQRLELQQQILDAIARHHGELPEILASIVNRVENKRPGMIASILLLDDDGKHIRTGAAPSLPKAWNDAVDGAEIGPSTGSCGTAAFRNERVVVSDIATDPLWTDYREAALAIGLKACWSEPIRDPGGNVLGTFAMYYHEVRHPSDDDLQLIGQIANLTGLAIENCRSRAALETARQQEAQLASIVEHSNDLIFAHDLDGVVFTANAACKEQFGSDIIGKNVFDIVAPEHLPRAKSMLATKLMQGGNTIYEADAIDMAGRRHHLEINSKLISTAGKSVAVHAIARDLTVRKEAETKLDLLIKAIHASHEGIMVLDADGVVEFANPAAATLYRKPLNRMIGASAADLRGGQPGDATYREIISTVKRGDTWCGEMLFHPHDNEERLVARRISPIMDGNGKVHHQICIDRDITEAKQRDRQMEHTQRLESLGILAGGIAHDFNNLLTAILGNASMAERSMDNGGDLRTHLNRINEASQRAAELCKQMLAYSGKGHFVIKPVNLSELVGDMTRLMEVSLSKQVQMRYDLQADLPLIDADPAQIHQVILNLITNANEAIGDRHGEILFSTGVMQAKRKYLAATRTGEQLPAGEYVYFEVSDSGCGMDKATMEKMFDPFFTTKFTGRGLGMSAMLGIIRGHHGAILVDSKPGKGSTFRVLLPVSAESATQQHAAAAADAGSDHGQGAILVVDDEAHIREVACMMLEEVGFDTIPACNGEEAVALYRQRLAEVDAVLLDMTMPKMDGKACFAALLNINPEVKVILSSGYSAEEINEQFADHPPASFIQKPYTPESLQQRIKQILS